MARNSTRAPKDANRFTTSIFASLFSWRAVVSWVLVISLGGLSWASIRHLGQAREMVGFGAWLFFLHGCLALMIERGQALFPILPSWRYRFAFLASLGLALIYLILGSLAAYPLMPLWRYCLAFVVCAAGAFAGALFATSLAGPLWENNAPPAARIRKEVYRLHRQQTGNPDPEPGGKRLFDLSLAIVGLALSSPVWIACSFFIWFEDPGPILFVKNSVGKGGKNFHQYKFRTMVSGAEGNTGPVLASEHDQRVLASGRLLRKTALDELPQLINILRGEMSLVGPRPQRTVLVHEYLEDMPEYAERHLVLPGLSGLAQVAGDYYLTPRQKLRFDRLYIHHRSVGFDVKLLVLAFLITFWFRWKKDWNGRLPRKLLHEVGKVSHPEPEGLYSQAAHRITATIAEFKICPPIVP
jgi:lipopolysaccharide/colanic/teichoic acid biosynthesis glycosyltransferase